MPDASSSRPQPSRPKPTVMTDDHAKEWDMVPEDFGTGTWRVDQDGVWYHDGQRVERRELVTLLASHVRRTEEGGFVFRWGPYEHALEVADAPVVVHEVRVPAAAGAGLDADLVDGRTVRIDPATLRVGAGHVLYGALPGDVPVRFSRTAYYQLADHIRETADGFVLVMGPDQVPLRTGVE